MPERIQLRRTRGWRKPEGAVTVARPTKWGNPVDWRALLEDGHSPATARQTAAELFRDHLVMDDMPVPYPSIRSIRAELEGKDLACWCPPQSDGVVDHCHAAVLLEVANAPLADVPGTAEHFNAIYPVGTPVEYWPGHRAGAGTRSATRTPAWEVGSGHVVVSVEGCSGGIALSHVLPLKDAAVGSMTRA